MNKMQFFKSQYAILTEKYGYKVTAKTIKPEDKEKLEKLYQGHVKALEKANQPEATPEAPEKPEKPKRQHNKNKATDPPETTPEAPETTPEATPEKPEKAPKYNKEASIQLLKDTVKALGKGELEYTKEKFYLYKLDGYRVKFQLGIAVKIRANNKAGNKLIENGIDCIEHEGWNIKYEVVSTDIEKVLQIIAIDKTPEVAPAPEATPATPEVAPEKPKRNGSKKK